MNTVITPLSPFSEKALFEGFETVEPKDLISFHLDYLYHREEVQKYLFRAFKKKGPIKLLLKRINSDGSFQEKIVSGTVKKIEGIQFEFHTKEDINNKYDHTVPILLRTDNILGNIPLLPSATGIKIANVSDTFFPFTEALEQMKQVLENCVGIKHSAWINFRFDEEHPVERNGNYTVACQIKKVNKSNVEYTQFKASAYVSHEERISTIGPFEKISRFVSPDCYISGVFVEYGIEHEIDLYDNGD